MKIRIGKGFCFSLAFALALLPIGAMAAVLEIDDQEGAKDAEVVFTVSVNNPPQDADTLAMDITYEATGLRFVAPDFGGTLLQNWDTKEVTNPEPGIIRINAKTAKDAIKGNAKGAVVKIKFTVSGDEDFELAIKNLKGGGASWSTKGGNFKAFKIPST